MPTNPSFSMLQSNRTLGIPLILDEPYDLVADVQRFGTGFDGGLLAGGDAYPADLLSMSGYKGHLDDVHDYENTKAFSEPSYVFRQPQTEAPYELSVPTSGEDLAFIRHQESFQPQIEASHQYLGLARQPPFPKVVSWNPQQGRRGSRINVQISSLHELEGAYSFPIVFGQKRQISEMTRIKLLDQYNNYTLSSEVPAFQTTRSDSSPVKLSLQMINSEGQVLGAEHIGDYYFTDTSVPPEDLSRKRRQSEDSMDLKPKRVVTENYIKDRERSLPRSRNRTSVAAYSPFIQPQPTPVAISPRQSQYPYSPPSVMPPRSASPGWNPNYMENNSRLIQAPGLGITHARTRRLPGESSSQTPLLVRASTISQSTSTPAPHFNPWQMNPSKAVLEIDGDLDTMTEGNWDLDEWAAKRRIVRFRRRQSGSTITTTFEPVSIDERPANSICISCIWWEEKKECYVTSVDTIYLLESLVAVRFTVEEKNRIRRNLEGFRPLTVSKAKSDSEEFFKIIMGFPNPKPRNIEKDVKVFPWKILNHALKKIIGKYSASYSSTAGVLLPAAPPGYNVSTGPSSSLDAMMPQQRPTPSPRSTSASTSSVIRTPSLTSLAYSPNPNAGMPYAATTPDGRVHPSPLSGATYTGAGPPGWAQQQQQQQQQAFSDQATAVYPVTTQGPRAAWSEYSAYLEATPASTVTSGHHTHHQHQQQPQYYSNVHFPTSNEEVVASMQRRMSHHTTGA